MKVIVLMLVWYTEVFLNMAIIDKAIPAVIKLLFTLLFVLHLCQEHLGPLENAEFMFFY